MFFHNPEFIAISVSYVNLDANTIQKVSSENRNHIAPVSVGLLKRYFLNTAALRAYIFTLINVPLSLDRIGCVCLSAAASNDNLK